VEDILTLPFITLVISIALAIFGYVGTNNSEGHITQLAANAAARMASQDPNPLDAVDTAVNTLQDGGLPATWNGAPVIDPNNVHIGSSDNGKLISTTVTVNAPVAFPGLLHFLKITSGPTQAITRTGIYANEWNSTSNNLIYKIPPGGGAGKWRRNITIVQC
jgi:hypothetical protein